MSDLTALIRLHKHELDEKRQALGKLYVALAQLERERRELERAVALEKEAVANTGDIHFTFARYIEKVKLQRKALDEREARLEKEIAAVKDSLMATFSELKKYEMTQAERDRLEKEERAVKESREMDDIGISGFRRNQEQDS